MTYIGAQTTCTLLLERAGICVLFAAAAGIGERPFSAVASLGISQILIGSAAADGLTLLNALKNTLSSK